MPVKVAQSIILDKSRNKGAPLYEQIRRKLQETIASDSGLRVGDRLPSISLLAKELDVNYRTIKAAYDMLEKDGIIAIEANKGAVVTRKNAIAAWNAAQKLAMNFVTCRHTDGYFVKVAEGIREFSQKHNLIYNLVDVGHSRERFIDAVTQPGIDVNGLLLLPLERPGYAEAVCEALENDTKVVLIDRILPGVDVSSVESDHFTGAYQATNHLLQEHGRPVYYLGFVDRPSSCRDWVKGWSQAMYGYNYYDLDAYMVSISVGEEDLTADNDVGLEYDVEAAIRLLESHKEEIYCIYAGNDFIARGVYIAAEKLGMRIGRDIFVVGYNDMPFAERFDVPLSTIRQLPSIKQVGYEAAKLLYESMIGVIERPVRRLLPTELVVRQSSARKVNKDGGGSSCGVCRDR